MNCIECNAPVPAYEDDMGYVYYLQFCDDCIEIDMEEQLSFEDWWSSMPERF